MRMTPGEVKKEKIAYIKSECNGPKSDLMRLHSKLQDISPSHAAKLDKIIAELEYWQNS